MNINLIRFDMEIGRQKPETIINSSGECPFCHPETLTEIIAEDEGGIILLKNKYNVLDDADQFVLIETAECGADIPDYSPEHMKRLMRFGINHWRRMEGSGKYSAVIFFKNHGRLSGGTMRHAHMQIVGLRSADPLLFTEEADFDGITVISENKVTVNAASRPRLGFGEFNVIAEAEAPIDTLSDFIQKTTAFVKYEFGNKRPSSPDIIQAKKEESSYNIFFYSLPLGKTGIKIMPRFATSPLLIGYGIRLLPSNMAELAEKLKKKFFMES